MLSTWRDRVLAGESLSEAEAAQCLETIFAGGVSDEDIAAFLVALAEKGETADEIVGFSSVLLQRATPLNFSRNCIDVCGTGGSGLSRFNVSTAAAFVLAAAGIPVAKHGNRGSRRANGSFDLLEALGCAFELSPERAEQLFDETGLCFVYARAFHPIMGKVVRARKLADRRTIFNLAAPLCNPADPPFQVVGASSSKGIQLITEVLVHLGRKRSVVFCGEPGIDEVSISGETHWVEYESGQYTEGVLKPSDLGVNLIPYEEIPGGDFAENKVTFEQLMMGKAVDSIVDFVAVNAGVALYCADAVENMQAGYKRSRELLENGAVREKFGTFRSRSQLLSD